MKYIEMVIVADLSMHQKYGKNTTSLKNKVHEMVNVMNMDFNSLNISVVLVGFEIWDNKDQFEVSASPWQTLKQFSLWRMENLVPRKEHDNAQFITNIDFEGITVGLGNVGLMCSEMYSTGIVQDHSTSAIDIGATLVHEVGHNLGMSHDDKNCSCPSGPCIMDPFLRYGQKC
ncbi:unnamed protein product [Staurois parvus]|uniref:Peptidase M12B domain-containing protein n=1 Tax=Staurois parvus TaxID=386267 RepID=A0ABN9HFJ6_9NEOB|nr:unnamed protein product [Staurois parvus]